MKHNFERYDDTFACPNCENPLPHDEFPQTCLECGFTIEVFLSRDDAQEALAAHEENPDSITTPTNHDSDSRADAGDDPEARYQQRLTDAASWREQPAEPAPEDDALYRTFAEAVLAERARLALVDPDGEHESIAPLTGVRARQILLELVEPAEAATGPAQIVAALCVRL